MTLTFPTCTVFSTDTVTHLVTGYGSTHDALDIVIMSEVATWTAFVQSLVATVEWQGTEMQKVHSVLDNVNRVPIVDSAESAGTEVYFPMLCHPMKTRTV